MRGGKKTCEVLKQIRQQVADANGISYAPTPCSHKGDCLGTCPACEAEVSYIEGQLAARGRMGLPLRVAGVAAGALSMMAPTAALAQTPVVRDVDPAKVQKTEVEVVDLSDGATDVVTIRGMIVSATDGEPIIGAMVKPEIKKIRQAAVSNINGLFALKAARGSKLQVVMIGTKSQTFTAEADTDNLLVALEDDDTLQGEVVIAGGVSNRVSDDVYGRYSKSRRMKRAKEVR